ncbi:hypothetical protein KIPB_003824 [Kipferlia bialata]|uniref:Uncharacterized protein n=1 Tax=Kipferlia bialata TaxID=797122 RepID=A0A391NVJ4_9EUKA|nr:hypothetical protein KIPB_003824 [Kipferlia bialata]|eukprot:g3824.t1
MVVNIDTQPVDGVPSEAEPNVSVDVSDTVAGQGAKDAKDTDIMAVAKSNVRAFILCRLVFSARFYYPVFLLVFQDFGLSVAEFSWLNALWSVVIILLEVRRLSDMVSLSQQTSLPPSTWKR